MASLSFSLISKHKIMADNNPENRPESKPQGNAGSADKAKNPSPGKIETPKDDGKTPKDEGSTTSRQTGERVCEALKTATDVTKRKTGSWLNATFKAIENLAGNIAKKTEQAAEEDRKGKSAGQSAAAKTDSAGSQSAATKKTAAKKTSAKKTATKKSARKRTATKKTAAKKSSAKKAATKKSAGTPKKTPVKKAPAKGPPTNPSDKPDGV